MWQVKPDYVGRVTIEKECNHLVLTNELTQEDLAKLSQSPMSTYFLEQVADTENSNEG